MFISKKGLTKATEQAWASVALFYKVKDRQSNDEMAGHLKYYICMCISYMQPHAQAVIEPMNEALVTRCMPMDMLGPMFCCG